MKEIFIGLFLLVLFIAYNQKAEHFGSNQKTFNHRAFSANNWHLRFPYMVKQRYSYTDKPPFRYPIFGNVGYAKLRELPSGPKSHIEINRFPRKFIGLYTDFHQSVHHDVGSANDFYYQDRDRYKKIKSTC